MLEPIGGCVGEAEPLLPLGNDGCYVQALGPHGFLMADSNGRTFVPGAGHGVACLTANASKGWVAYAERGFQPTIFVVAASPSAASPSAAVVARLARPPADAVLAYAALAFDDAGALLISIDAKPSAAVIVWDLQTQRPLLRAVLPGQSPAPLAPPLPCNLAVAPGSTGQFAVVAAGLLSVWRVQKCEPQAVLLARPVPLEPAAAALAAVAPESLSHGLSLAQRPATTRAVAVRWRDASHVLVTLSSDQLLTVDATAGCVVADSTGVLPESWPLTATTTADEGHDALRRGTEVLGACLVPAPNAGGAWLTVTLDGRGTLLVRDAQGRGVHRTLLACPEPTLLAGCVGQPVWLAGSRAGSVSVFAWTGAAVQAGPVLDLAALVSSDTTTTTNAATTTTTVTHAAVDATNCACLVALGGGAVALCALGASPRVLGLIPAPSTEVPGAIVALAIETLVDGTLKFAVARSNSLQTGKVPASAVGGIRTGAPWSTAAVTFQHLALTASPHSVCLTADGHVVVTAASRALVADVTVYGPGDLDSTVALPQDSADFCHLGPTRLCPLVGGHFFAMTDLSGSVSVWAATGAPPNWTRVAHTAAATLPGSRTVIPPWIATCADGSVLAVVDGVTGHVTHYAWGDAAVAGILAARGAPIPINLTSATVAYAAASTREANPQATLSPAANQLVGDIGKLRAQLLSLIDANEARPEPERLARAEYTLDLEEQARLNAEEQTTLNALRESIELEILAQKYLRHVVKQQCWDSMSTVGRILHAFDRPLEVSNYPVRKRTAAEERVIERTRNMRLLERAELAAVAALAHQDRDAFGGGSGAGHAGLLDAAATAATSADLALTAAAVETAGKGAAGAGGAGDAAALQSADLLYNPLALHSVQRKRAQIVLLQDQSVSIKEAFNRDFDDLAQSKKEEISKMTDRNARIAKIGAELRVAVQTPTVRQHLLENPQDLLEVRDHEIRVERVLNAAEREEAAAAAAAAAARAAEAAVDNPRDRGVKDMMAGRLEDSAEEDVWHDLPRPAFLDDPRLRPEEYSDEQKAEAAAYSLACKALDEARVVRRKTLESDLAKLTEANSVGRAHFDERLNDLFFRRVRDELRVYACEMQLMLLTHTLAEDEASSDALAKLQTVKAELLQRHANLGLKVAEAKAAVDALRVEYDAMVVADKRLDRDFKQRKDVSESQFVDVILRLFRRRPARAAADKDAVDTERLPSALMKDIDCPEVINGESGPVSSLSPLTSRAQGLEDAVWDKLVALRDEKIASEAALRAKAQQLERRTGHHASLGRELQRLLEETQRVQREAEGLAVRRAALKVDYPVVVELKQGFVELTHVMDVDPDFSVGVLLPRTHIEELNAAIRALGIAKGDFLKQRMELNKGVHLLEWEHAKLAMERDDLIKKTKDVQMLRVTKTTMNDDGLEEAERHRRENDVLEKTLRVNEAAFQRSLNEKMSAAAALKKRIAAKAGSADSLEEQIGAVAEQVDTRTSVHKIQHEAITSHTQDMLRTRVAQRGMVEVVRAQSEDLATLRAELDRLRLRSFPAFSATHTVPF